PRALREPRRRPRLRGGGDPDARARVGGIVRTIRIGDHSVGDGERCFIIAEAGVNHNGDVGLARKLVEVAVKAGADAVKFQKRSIPDILIREALEVEYRTPNSLGDTYGEHRERLELSPEAYGEITALCRASRIT